MARLETNRFRRVLNRMFREYTLVSKCICTLYNKEIFLIHGTDFNKERYISTLYNKEIFLICETGFN